MRAQLQQRCIEHKASGRLPPEFKCNQSTPILQAALKSIEERVLAARTSTHLSTVSHVFAELVLPRLHLVLIRRMMTLNLGLRAKYNDDRFWRIHIAVNIPNRHNEAVIGSMYGRVHPFRTYALVFSPKRATRIYRLHDSHGEPRVTTPDVARKSFIDFRRIDDAFVLLNSDHRLLVAPTLLGLGSLKELSTPIAALGEISTILQPSRIATNS